MKTLRSVSQLILFFTLVQLSACSSNDVTPQVVDDDTPATLGGKYTGGWTSTTQYTSFSSYPISIDLVLSADKTKMSGDFYATGNFTSCCNSGASDGKIVLAMDGDIITDFSYDDIIPNCMGRFYGSGVIIKANGNLIIDFTGTDCDGDHVGQLVFKKK